MASEHKPWLGGPGAICDQQADVLRSVTWGMQNLDGDVPKRQDLPVANAPEPLTRFRFREKYVFRAASLRQPWPCREVIGVNVGVDDIGDFHPARARRIEIGLDVAYRINHGSAGLTATAKEIRNRYRIGVQELP